MLKIILLAISISFAWSVMAQESGENSDQAEPVSASEAAEADGGEAEGDDDTLPAEGQTGAGDNAGSDGQTAAPAELTDDPAQPPADDTAVDSSAATTAVSDDASAEVPADGVSGDAGSAVEVEQGPGEDQPPAERQRRQIRRLGDIDRDAESEWTLDIPQGLIIQQQPSFNVQVPDQQLNDQLQQVLIQQANNPDSETVAEAVEGVLQNIEQNADVSLENGQLQQAAAYLNAINTLAAERPGLVERQARLQSLRDVEALQAQLTQAFVDDRLLQPEADNALSYINQILTIDPDNEQALTSRDELQQRLLERATVMGNELAFEQAGEMLDQIEEIGGNADIAAVRQLIQGQRLAHAADLENRSRTALDAGNIDLAEQLMNELIALGDADASAEALRKSIADVRQYGGMVPGQVFRDSYDGGNSEGPVMMVLPAGSFMMGSPESEPNRRDSESPLFRVTFARGFALSQREVSVAEFRRFIQSSGYRTDAERFRESSYYDEDTGRLATGAMTWQNDYSGGRADNDEPVLHVSWNDANAYAEWLADITQRRYRLPSEAELEYAIRGGTQSTYWWGDAEPPQDEIENVTGSGDISTSRRRWNDAFDDYEDGYWGPAPVATMSANPFGLFDINGNVKEWSADCWHVNYNRAPEDGSAWINPGCESRVVRGADWSSTPAQSRSAMRISARMQTRGPRVGIRVARDL